MALRLPVLVVRRAARIPRPPNTASFPAFFALDLVVYKTMTIKGRE